VQASRLLEKYRFHWWDPSLDFINDSYPELLELDETLVAEKARKKVKVGVSRALDTHTRKDRIQITMQDEFSSVDPFSGTTQ
jgi:hypothetical protein